MPDGSSKWHISTCLRLNKCLIPTVYLYFVLIESKTSGTEFVFIKWWKLYFYFITTHLEHPWNTSIGNEYKIESNKNSHFTINNYKFIQFL